MGCLTTNSVDGLILRALQFDQRRITYERRAAHRARLASVHVRDAMTTWPARLERAGGGTPNGRHGLSLGLGGRIPFSLYGISGNY
jgi:hypothetical protein